MDRDRESDGAYPDCECAAMYHSRSLVLRESRVLQKTNAQNMVWFSKSALAVSWRRPLTLRLRSLGKRRRWSSNELDAAVGLPFREYALSSSTSSFSSRSASSRSYR